MAKKAKKKVKKASKKKASKKVTKKSAKKTGKKTAKKAKKKARRTTMYSSKGKKLYAVRSADGQFKDIQTYQRAHSMDLKQEAKAES